MNTYETRAIPGWSYLSRVGQSRVLRSSYFWLFAVPLLAKALAKIPTELQIPWWGTSIPIHLGLPFSWRVFFFASAAFAVASLVYSLACPPIIRDYGRFAEFREEGRGGAQLLIALNDLAVSSRVLGHGDALVERLNLFLVKYEKSASMIKEPWELPFHELPEEKLPDAFWQIRGFADRAAPAARALSAVAYLAGFVLIGVVVIQNFVFVVNYVMS